ncbi:MAG: associated Golgi protein-like protein [Actinomycetia bacterium]|nr:associated Golgi protein-like protein [Actinomycetes bacterium]
MNFGIDWLAFGLIGVLFVLFAETGLLIGFFLPGDTLLVAAGIATSSSPGKHALSLPMLMVLAPVCAIAGAQFGHFLGAKYGRKLFDRPNSRLFKQAHVDKAEYYFNRFHPSIAVVIARFVPVVRTFLNPLAGMLEMPARKFFVWNVIGAVIWTESIILLGHFLGAKVQGIDKVVLPIVVLVMVVSVAPVIRELLRGRGDSGKKNDSDESRPSLSGDSSR